MRMAVLAASAALIGAGIVGVVLFALRRQPFATAMSAGIIIWGAGTIADYFPIIIAGAMVTVMAFFLHLAYTGREL